MAKVFFTSHLRSVAPHGGVDVAGVTVQAALDEVFTRHPALRSYIVDDQGRLRLHIAVFVDNVHIRKDALDHALKPDSEVYIMQALSGG